MKRGQVVVFGALLSILSGACGSSSGPDAEPTKPKIQVVTGHASAAPGSFEAVAFECCDVPEVKSVVDRFVALGVTLAADDLEGSKAGAKAFAEALRVDGARLTGGAQPGDAEIIGKLNALAARMVTHGAIQDLREEYLDASVEVLTLAKTHRATGDTYAVAFCPMKPGRWLQTASPLANPYYGSEMLRCGTFEALGDAN